MILLLGGAILTAGDIVMKKWAVTTDWRLLSLGMLLWIGGLCCLATTIKHQNIAVASTVLVLSNVTILAVVVAIFRQRAFVYADRRIVVRRGRHLPAGRVNSCFSTVLTS